AAARPYSDPPGTSNARNSTAVSSTVLLPQRLDCEPGARHQSLELSPHDGRVDATVKWPLREAAIGSRDHSFAADEPREANHALGDEFGMLHDIGRMTDHAWDKKRTIGKLDVLPHLPFVLMARICAF